MRRLMCVLLLFTLLAGSAAAEAQGALKTFTNPDGRFSVRLPGTPTEQAQDRKPGDTSPATHTFVLAVKESAYFVAYTDFSADQLANKDAAAILIAARDGAMKNVKGTVITEKPVNVSGYPGRDVLASLSLDSKPGSAHMVIVLAKTRLYSVLYVGTAGSAGSADTDAFLKSFQILGGEAQDGWTQFSSTDGNFTIRMPGKPKEQTSTGAGGAQVHQTVLDKGDYAYIVAWNVLGGGAPDAAIASGLLNKGRDGLLASGHGKLLEEKSITLNGSPGKYVRVTMPQANGVAMVRAYIVGDHYYQLMLIGAVKALETAGAERFFSSFQADPPKTARDWKNFSVKEGRFSIDFPGEPKQESLPDNVSKFTAQLGGTTYIVVYVDIPEVLTDPDQITKVLESVKDAELKAIKGTAISQKRIKLGEDPGLQVNFSIAPATIPGGGYGIERFYLLGKRVYEVGVLTASVTAEESSFARFFDSFKTQAP